MSLLVLPAGGETATALAQLKEHNSLKHYHTHNKPVSLLVLPAGGETATALAQLKEHNSLKHYRTPIKPAPLLPAG